MESDSDPLGQEESVLERDSLLEAVPPPPVEGVEVTLVDLLPLELMDSVRDDRREGEGWLEEVDWLKE